MSSNAKHRRATQRRKDRQAEEKYVAALRREAVNFEGAGPNAVKRMSKERLEEVVRKGKRRRGITGGPLGAPNVAVAALLGRRA